MTRITVMHSASTVVKFAPLFCVFELGFIILCRTKLSNVKNKCSQHMEKHKEMGLIR